MILKLLEEARIEIHGFCDSAKEKQGAYVGKYRIYEPSEICADPDNNHILVSPENSSEIERFLEKMGYVLEENYYIIKSDIYGAYCNEFYRKGAIDYILFGDCYFTDLDIDALHEKSMGEMALEHLGEDKAKVLSLHGMCIPSFYYLMKMQIRMGIVPKAVAFIVNIPFCNRIQTKLPQSQHTALLRMIQDRLLVKDKEFDDYVDLTDRRSQNLDAGSFSTKGGKSGQEYKHIEKLLTKARYMYEFDEESENIVFMKKMLELLLENNIKPVPFISALNYSVGIDFYGEEFMQKYTKICEGIKQCVEQYGVSVLDMSFLLQKEYYLGERMTKFPKAEGKEKEIATLCECLRS